MGTIIILVAMFVACMFLYSVIGEDHGFWFFLIWMGICALLWLLNPTFTVGGVIIYLIVYGYSGEFTGSSTSSQTSTWESEQKSSGSRETYMETVHSGTGYCTGNTTNYSNGTTSITEGNVTYFDGGRRSVQQGTVTYYYDDGNRQVGHAVDRGNGVRTYFDTSNKEIGHSYTNGRTTDYTGSCFELRSKW